MAAKKSSLLYQKVVRVTHVYLGPSADRFISRQIQNHLNKPAEELSEDDLAKLIDWIKGAVSLLTEDSEVVEEYVEQLKKLAQPATSRHNQKAD